MHVELKLAYAMLVASWGISDGRLDIEDFSFSALRLVQFRRLFFLQLLFQREADATA